MVEPVFADGGSQEEVLVKKGSAVLLRKAGKLELRKGQVTVMKEWGLNYYKRLKPYLRGDVLEVGFGMGLFCGLALKNAKVKSVTSIEINKDFIDVYKERNVVSSKLVIINDDVRNQIKKLSKKFDVVLYDLDWNNSQEDFSLLLSFLGWAKKHLKTGGMVIINQGHPQSVRALLEKTGAFSSYVYNQDKIGLGRQEIYVVLKWN